MLLHIAYKAEKGMDMRQENSIAKVYPGAYGAQGDRHRDPAARRARLQPGHAARQLVHPIRSQRLVDGPDEVHRWKVGRNVIKAFREHGTTALAAGGDLL